MADEKSSRIEFTKPEKRRVDLKRAIISLLSVRHKKVKEIHKQAMIAQREEKREAKAAKEAEDKEAEKYPRKDEFNRLRSDLDLLGARVMALQELTKGHTESIMFVSEHVGEFKSYIVDLEKNLNKLLVQVNKNSVRLDDINPVGARKAIALQNAKIEAVEEMFTSFKEMNNALNEQIKQIKAKLSQIKNIEPLMKLDQEMNEKVIELQKLAMIVDRHSTKSEQIYTDMQNHIKNMSVMKKQFDMLQTSVNEVLKEMDKMRISASKASSVFSNSDQ